MAKSSKIRTADSPVPYILKTSPTSFYLCYLKPLTAAQLANTLQIDLRPARP